jgi:hypothetical protein
MRSPPMEDALLISPPARVWINFGITGMIMPNPMTSMSTVTKIKPIAADRELVDIY